MTSERATIREVAEAAGVSRSTVSRALTGQGYVAPPVRDRVRAVARDLGYVADATARHLRHPGAGQLHTDSSSSAATTRSSNGTLVAPIR